MTLAFRKLSAEERENVIRLYQLEGWHIIHIARLYDLHHSSIQHYIKGVERKVPAINYCPHEVEEKSAQWKQIGSGIINRGKLCWSYEEYFEQEQRRREKKRAACKHTTLAVICIDCGKHLEKTKTHDAEVDVVWLNRANDKEVCT